MKDVQARYDIDVDAVEKFEGCDSDGVDIWIFRIGVPVLIQFDRSRPRNEGNRCWIGRKYL